MDSVKSIWVMLSLDAVSCCHEPHSTRGLDSQLMPLDLLAQIVKMAKELSWTCTILGNGKALPRDHQSLCDEMEAHVVLPAESVGFPLGKRLSLVFESDCVEKVTAGLPCSHAILRVKRDDLPRLCKLVSTLLNRCPVVSVRHPELLQYDDSDLMVYRDQLFQVGQWLVDRHDAWCSYHVDCLTDHFQPSHIGECGAGIGSLAIGPTGEIYLCPAALRGGMPSYGHILGDLKIPNRSLLTKEFSLPCGRCEAFHCRRCVYLNKCGTMEFCVPPKNACRIGHLEREVQVWLTQELIQKKQWKSEYRVPSLPTIHDPYELIKSEEAPPLADTWRRLVKFTGHPKDLQSSMMLDIIHGLQGWCQALLACAEAGCSPDPKQLERDVLASLRRRAIEPYHDVVFQENCPTVRQIEVLMTKLASQKWDLS